MSHPSNREIAATLKQMSDQFARRAYRICSVCNVELRPYKTGVTLAEMATFGPQALYSADEYDCAICNWTGILARAEEPFSRGTVEQLEEEIAAYESKGIRVVRYWLNEREKQTYEKSRQGAAT